MTCLPPQVAALARDQRGVVSRGQVLAAGLSEEAARHAVRTGRWQRLLPGVYLTQSGAPHRAQLLSAALLHAGGGAALDAATACTALGLRSMPASPVIDVVMPHDRRLAPVPWMRVRRTVHPIRARHADGFPVVVPAVAVVTATLRTRELGEVRALVAEAVQRRLVTVSQLEQALAQAARRGSRLARRVLGEVADGVRSVPEADFMRVVAAAGVPKPLLNCRLYGSTGWLADPDAYWPEAGLVHEVDSMAWHLSPASWERTMRRHARMTAAGLAVLHSSPERVRTDRAALAGELRAAYRTGAARGPVPGIRVADPLR